MVIKGKHKYLSLEENIESIREAHAGLANWRQVIKRPRRRVTIAYHWIGDNKDLWAEFEWRQRYYRDSQDQFRLGSVITYHRQSEKPKGGFIADGRAYSIERPSDEIAKVNYAFADLTPQL